MKMVPKIKPNSYYKILFDVTHAALITLFFLIIPVEMYIIDKLKLKIINND